jgi:UDP-N-acetylglucosamine--N-acetylmuramyl-(pentapeptide) pyrophosphoryl-undecaprenol N-acetylglucosamine transferase
MVTGGGTGGHIYPALALARGWLSRGEGRSVRFVGSRRGMEAGLVSAAGIPFHALPVRGFRGKGPVQRLLFLLELIPAILGALILILRHRPEAVIATGSFASLPLLSAARLSRLPYFLQEQNSVPGRVIAMFAGGARGLFLAYPEAGERLASGPPRVLSGNPLRDEFLARTGDIRRERDPGPLRLLAFGGSLGARRLNAALREALPGLLTGGAVEAVLQTGPAELAITREALASSGKAARVEAYLHDMPEQMLRADLVICRAGAMTLSEITLLGLPAILVPFPHAVDDHQSANAEALVRAGAALLIPDEQLDGPRLVELLAPLLADPERRREMAAASARLGRPEACAIILDGVEKSLAGPGSR